MAKTLITFDVNMTIGMEDGTITHKIILPGILTVKVAERMTNGSETIVGTAWINRADEPKSKALLYCKFKAVRSTLDGKWEISFEGDDLSVFIKPRLSEIGNGES